MPCLAPERVIQADDQQAQRRGRAWQLEEQRRRPAGQEGYRQGKGLTVLTSHPVSETPPQTSRSTCRPTSLSSGHSELVLWEQRMGVWPHGRRWPKHFSHWKCCHLIIYTLPSLFSLIIYVLILHLLAVNVRRSLAFSILILSK